MRIFGRRGRDEQPEGDEQVSDVVDEPEDHQEEPVRRGLSPRPEGPWDDAEIDSQEGYVDLGALRLLGREGMELRLDVDEATRVVTSATVQLGGSAVQLQVFAAPRSQGIWEEIREEIAAGIVEQGGSAQEQTGVFGPELLARIPMRTEDGRRGHQPARFAGIDGPRWFLRAVFHGDAVSRPEAAVELESVVREVVVIRGSEAMAPRELLPLQLPQEVTGGQLTTEPAESDPDGASHQDLHPFERGPEITEIR